MNLPMSRRILSNALKHHAGSQRALNKTVSALSFAAHDDRMVKAIAAI
jgi:hypothetical protein